MPYSPVRLFNSVISTTTPAVRSQPRGVAGSWSQCQQNRPGHGSTNCLTSDGIAAQEDTINNGEPEDEWLDVDSLPPCPLSTAPADLEALDLDSSRAFKRSRPRRTTRSVCFADPLPARIQASVLKQPTTQDTPPTVTTPHSVCARVHSPLGYSLRRSSRRLRTRPHDEVMRPRSVCRDPLASLGYTSVEAADDSGHTADGDDPAACASDPLSARIHLRRSQPRSGP